MPIRFAGDASAIDRFNANVARGDQERRAEEQDFMRRMQMEQAQGVDAAQRSGASAFFARPQAAPVQTTQFQPTPAAVPNPALTTPVVSPDQSMNPADNPDYGGPTRAAPMPNAVPGLGAGVPATVPGQPAIASVTAQPPSMQARPGASGRDSYAQMASTFAKTPGMGSTMMGMANASMTSDRAAAVEQRKMDHEGVGHFVAARKNKDIESMRLVNRQYKLGIPEEVLNNREATFQMMTSMDLAENIGKAKNPEMVMGFSKGYMHAKASGASDQQAIQAGNAEAQKIQPTFKATHWDHGPDNEVVGFNAKGEQLKTGFKSRAPQPPFNLSDIGKGQHQEQVRQQAVSGAIKRSGGETPWKAIVRADPSRANAMIAAEEAYITKGTPVPRNLMGTKRDNPLLPGGGAAPAAGGTEGPAKRMYFDSQANEIPGPAP